MINYSTKINQQQNKSFPPKTNTSSYVHGELSCGRGHSPIKASRCTKSKQVILLTNSLYVSWFFFVFLAQKGPELVCSFRVGRLHRVRPSPPECDRRRPPRVALGLAAGAPLSTGTQNHTHPRRRGCSRAPSHGRDDHPRDRCTKKHTEGKVKKKKMNPWPGYYFLEASKDWENHQRVFPSELPSDCWDISNISWEINQWLGASSDLVPGRMQTHARTHTNTHAKVRCIQLCVGKVGVIYCVFMCLCVFHGKVPNPGMCVSTCGRQFAGITPLK